MDGEAVVGRFDAPHEAELAASYLRQHGLAARVDNDVLVGMNPLWGSALGGVRLYVPEADAETALELLAALRASEPPAEVAPGVDSVPPSVEEPSASGDDDARRALLAAVFGVFILPIVSQLYALLLLARARSASLSDRGWWRFGFALVVSLLTLTVQVVWIAHLFGF